MITLNQCRVREGQNGCSEVTSFRTIAHHGKDPVLAQAKRLAKAQGLPVHGAPMPLELAFFFGSLPSAEGDLVVYPFA